MQTKSLKIRALLSLCVIVAALLWFWAVRHGKADKHHPASGSPSPSLGSDLNFERKLLSSPVQPELRADFSVALRHINELISRHDYSTALKQCDVLSSLARTSWEKHRAQLTEANLLLATNHREKAWRLLRGLVETVEDPALIGFVTTKYYVTGRAVGEIENAILAMEFKWGEVPTELREARILAEIFMHDKQPEKELAVRLRIASDDTGALNLMRAAELQAQLGDNASAANTCALLSGLHPDNSSFFMLKKATFEKADHDLPSAISTCSQILSSSKSDSVTLLHTGLLLREMKNLAQASAAFELAESRAPETFRKQRCALEFCRTRILANTDDSSTWNRIQSLAANGLTDGVRSDAKGLLAGRH